MKIDTEKYHVKHDLGRDWFGHKLLDHIQPRIRHLAIPIGALVEDPSNVRLHNDPNLEGIRGSYAKYKQRVLLVVNTRTMVVEKGNGSLRTLRAGGHTYVAVLFVDDDPATATGFAIADNRTAETAAWDLPGLYGQLASLKEIGHEVPSIEQSFFDELVSLVGGPSFTPEGKGSGESPPGPSEPGSNEGQALVSERGEVYELGSCSLTCGAPEHADAIRKLWGDYARSTKTEPGTGAL